MPPEQIVRALEVMGYNVKSADQTLREIGEDNGVSPAVLYEAMKAGGMKPILPKSIEGTGLGRKTLEVICSEKGFPLEKVLSRLKQKGIEAKPTDKLKHIANRHNKAPIEISGIIKGRE